MEEGKDYNKLKIISIKECVTCAYYKPIWTLHGFCDNAVIGIKFIRHSCELYKDNEELSNSILSDIIVRE